MPIAFPEVLNLAGHPAREVASKVEAFLSSRPHWSTALAYASASLLVPTKPSAAASDFAQSLHHSYENDLAGVYDVVWEPSIHRFHILDGNGRFYGLLGRAAAQGVDLSDVVVAVRLRPADLATPDNGNDEAEAGAGPEAQCCPLSQVAAGKCFRSKWGTGKTMAFHHADTKA